MKKILFTGKTGFVGKNVLPYLQEKFDIDAPGRNELNLRDSSEVRSFIKRENYDVVIHCANPNPAKNPTCDSIGRMLDDSLRIFMNIYNERDYYGKLLYLGSGAEYDKSLPISMVHEEDAFRSIPKDQYGFAKYIMNSLSVNSDNVYNLRLFGCYGPYDHESKFMTHIIRCILSGQDITMRQDCMFDYIQVTDLSRVFEYFILNEPKYHDYNVCSGKPVSLVNIADEIKKQMNCDKAIHIEKEGLNLEYTACADRLEKETGLVHDFMPIETGIKKQIEFETEYYKSIG